MKTLFKGLILFTLALAFLSCSSKSIERKTNNSKTSKGEKTKITVVGSDTIVKVGGVWAEKYMKKNSNFRIQVTGGGSGVGIAALINGRADLANASRSMKDKEKKTFEDRGEKVIENIVAKDGLTVYLHKDNPIDVLSFEQLDKIYIGKITNWQEVGGNDEEIILYGRENSSGTYSYFKKYVLLKKDFAQKTQVLQGTAAIVNAIRKDKRGIGYGGKGYSEGIKSAKIKRTNAEKKAYSPTLENVKANKYPLARPLFIYTTDKILRSKPYIQKYLDWISSTEGQKIVDSEGYFPIK